jgi:hypothetical protein
LDPEDRPLKEQQAAILEHADTEIARAHDAKALLENPLLIEALDLIERTWEQGWRNTAPEDTEKREKAYRMLFALTEFKAELRTAIETGMLAAKTTDRLRGDEVGSSADIG